MEKTMKKLSENIMDKLSMDFLRNQELKNSYGNDDTVIAKLDPRVLLVWYLFFGLVPWFSGNVVFLAGCFMLVMATTLLAIGSRRLSKSLSLFRQADPDGDSQRMPHPSDAMHTTHRLAPGVHKAGNVMIFFLRHPSQVQSMHMDSDGIAVEHIARVATQLKCSAECDVLGRVCRVTAEECPGHLRLEQQPSVTIDGTAHIRCHRVRQQARQPSQTPVRHQTLSCRG